MPTSAAAVSFSPTRSRARSANSSTSRQRPASAYRSWPLLTGPSLWATSSITSRMRDGATSTRVSVRTSSTWDIRGSNEEERMNLKTTLTILFCLSLCIPPSATAQQGRPSEIDEKVDEFVKAQMQARKIPGLHLGFDELVDLLVNL